jgi:cell division protein ZapB
MDNRDFEDLEQRVDKLIHKCARLEEENRALRHQQTHLTTERAALIEKSELARSRVESMISRLKAMEA